MNRRSALTFAVLAAAGIALPATAQVAGRFAVLRTPASARIEPPAAIASSQDLMFVISASTSTSLSSAMLQNSTTAPSGTTTALRTSSGSPTAAMLQQSTATVTRNVPAPSRATFMVAGDAGQSISVTVPSEVDLTRTDGVETARLTTDTSVNDGPQFIGGDFATTGVLSFDVGGQVTLASADMSSGTYSGVLAVVAQYN